jgi:hypothetical protein
MYVRSQRIAAAAFAASNLSLIACVLRIANENTQTLSGPFIRLVRLVCLVTLFNLVVNATSTAQQPAEGTSERATFRSEQGSLRSDESEDDEIETDRDSFTPSTNVVGHRRSVIESSYSFIDNRRVYETHSLPETIARYGIGKNVELRFGFNYEIGGAGSPISGNVPGDLEDEPELEEESRVLYGTKVFLNEQADWLPQSAFIFQGYTPTSGEVSATTFSTSYVFGWKFRNKMVWDSAMRYSSGTFEEDSFNLWSPSTVIKVPMGEKWNVHSEYFGVFSEGRQRESTQHFFSPGIHYLPTKNMEVGVRVGWGLNDQSPNFFSNVGVGLRF